MFPLPDTPPVLISCQNNKPLTLLTFPLAQHLVELEIKKLITVLRVNVAEYKYRSNNEMNS